jgi:DNA-binding Lrp family transcriptional regulator
LSLVKQIKKTGVLPDLGMSKQARNFHVKKLKTDGIIRKIGYGTWEVNQARFDRLSEACTPFTSKNIPRGTRGVLINKFTKDIRGHGYIFIKNVSLTIGYKDRIKRLKDNKIPMHVIPSNNSVIIEILGSKVQLAPKRIVIYYSKEQFYTAQTANLCYSQAVNDLLKIFKELERILKIKINTKGQYDFEVARSHYARMNDELAQQVDEIGKSIRVYKDGELRFIIDDSLKLHETETVHKIYSREDMNTYQHFLISLLGHRDDLGFVFDAKEVQEKLAKEGLKLKELDGILLGLTTYIQKGFNESKDAIDKSITAFTGQIDILTKSQTVTVSQVAVLTQLINKLVELIHPQKDQVTDTPEKPKEKPDYIL